MRVSAMPTIPSSTEIPRQKVMRFSESKEVVPDASINFIHFYLQAVKKLVQAGGQDRLDRRVVELRSQQSQALLAGAGERSRPRAGNNVERTVGAPQAVPHGPGKQVIEQQELHDVLRRDPPMALAIHLKSADALQYRRPLHVVVRGPHVAP